MVAENSVTELQKTAGDFSKIPHLSRKMSNEEAFSPFLRTLSFFQNAAFVSCSPILVFIPRVHCKKRLAVFPSPARMSFTKLSLAGNN